MQFFTEQGSPASHMTAAKVMDTQVKLEDAPRFLKIPKSECPDIWIRLSRHKRPKSWSNIDEHPLAGLFWVRQFEEVLIRAWMGKRTKSGLSVCSMKTKIIFVCISGGKEAEYGSHVEIDEKR